ncbi:hypothetical protein [Mycolicibacterium austroafricanum]|uniref:hypothetical protein n=1 Tax=Mycolicibacterium austroafricanum TaxID=39687 RepID=UPI001CA32E69|nr:hypothetical protein [Mycolicibacterium austroafricanum]QZT65247.1 hypothetical protein JN085_13540 [Mycolicibacterium austroafricanum]
MTGDGSQPGLVSPAWATVHTDTGVARALQLMHETPSSSWTLASLARRPGSSRSALSRRFADALGEPPMGYLAFSAAFYRHHGIRPAAHRRAVPAI